MNKIFNWEFIVSAVLVLVLLTFLSGPELLMPMNFNSMALVLFAIFSIMFLGLIFRESAHDEREKLHKLEAGRIAYLCGIVVITIGIIIQSFSYNIDPWLVYTLITMIIIKIAVRIYAQIKH